MSNEVAEKFQGERTREECDLATMVGLCLARRMLMVVPDGGVTGAASRSALEKAILEVGGHDGKSRAMAIASKIALPALDDQPGSSIPLDAWSDAIWQAIDEWRERVAA